MDHFVGLLIYINNTPTHQCECNVDRHLLKCLQQNHKTYFPHNTCEEHRSDPVSLMHACTLWWWRLIQSYCFLFLIELYFKMIIYETSRQNTSGYWTKNMLLPRKSRFPHPHHLLQALQPRQCQQSWGVWRLPIAVRPDLILYSVSQEQLLDCYNH